MGKIGLGAERKKCIPMEVENEKGSISTFIESVLDKLKNSFETLFSETNSTENINQHKHSTLANSQQCNTDTMKAGISINDVAFECQRFS